MKDQKSKIKDQKEINLSKISSIANRREEVEKVLGVNLPNIGRFSLDEKTAVSRHCENMIGITQVPLGIAGPLRLADARSGQANNYYIPLATTEGALVASVNRGCKVITESGGVKVKVERVGATRGPVFRVENIEEGVKLENFLKRHFIDVKKAAEATSGHLKLLKYDFSGIGKYRFVRFYFDTQDAMGLNMVTIATDAIAKLVKQEIGLRCVSVSGNFCVDKKPSWQNIIQGRGFKVWAEVILTGDVLTRVLKAKAEQMYESWLAKCMIGSAISGSMGFNAQCANIIAAIFIACGQDPAHVVEGSHGITSAEVIPKSNTQDKNNLYVNVYIPSLMVGTVGGGTGLATQKEALEIMNVAGGNNGNNAEKFAGIVTGAVLAGEISLLASLAEGSLAKAHKKLARGQTEKQ